MDKVNFPYRSDSHLPFLHVVHDSGSWAKHGLDVNYDYEITSEDSHKNVANGTVEFVGGNHLSPYIRRPAGDKWVYLGQTVSLLNHRLVVRADSGINKVSDLKGKKVATKGKHPGLNTWLFIKQAGLLNDCQVEKAKGKFHWEAVRDGEADAAFVTPPADILVEARRAESHRRAVLADGVVHHGLQRPAVRRKTSRYHRQNAPRHLRRHCLLQDPSRRIDQDHQREIYRRRRSRRQKRRPISTMI